MFSLGTAIGAAGLPRDVGSAALGAASWVAWLAASNGAAMTGASLRRAAALHEEIRRFEAEPADEPPAPAR